MFPNYRVGNLLFHSCRSIKKSKGSESLLLLFMKRVAGAICFCRSFQKEWWERMSSSSNEWRVQLALYERVICSFYEWFTSISFFSPCFSPFYARNNRANRSSSLFLLFVKEGIALFVLWKRGTRAICSCRSLQKEWTKWFTLFNPNPPDGGA